MNAEIIAVARTASEPEDLSRFVTDRVDEEQVRFLIDCGFQHFRGNTWTLSIPHRGAICTDEEGAEEWGHEHQYSYDRDERLMAFSGDRQSEQEEIEEMEELALQAEVDRYTPARSPEPATESPPLVRCLPTARPRPEQPVAPRPGDPGYIATNDFS